MKVSFCYIASPVALQDFPRDLWYCSFDDEKKYAVLYVKKHW